MSTDSPEYTLMERWVKSLMSLCHFASSLMRHDSITLFEVEDSLDEIDVQLLNSALRGSADEEKPCILMFPKVRSSEDIHELISLLQADARWRCNEVQSELLAEEEQEFSVEWRTAEGKWSSCMGFAALLSMPVTRRAPFVGIALWPGTAKEPDSETVAFKDIPSPFEDPEIHRQMLTEVRRGVRDLVGDEESQHLYQIAFRLPKIDS
jgi:hypothetical protein